MFDHNIKKPERHYTSKFEYRNQLKVGYGYLPAGRLSCSLFCVNCHRTPHLH